MKCLLLISMLGRTELLIYGWAYFTLAIVVSILNAISFTVLCMPKKRSKHECILMSMVINDFLTGFLLYPFSVYQFIIGSGVSKSCRVDEIRTFSFTLLFFISLMTLVILAFYRYLLLTDYARYSRICSRRNIYILIISAWVSPVIFPLLKLLLHS